MTVGEGYKGNKGIPLYFPKISPAGREPDRKERPKTVHRETKLYSHCLTLVVGSFKTLLTSLSRRRNKIIILLVYRKS